MAAHLDDVTLINQKLHTLRDATACVACLRGACLRGSRQWTERKQAVDEFEVLLDAFTGNSWILTRA